ncbi:MAG: AMP-binding protein, partial [Thaumarchaeota archaeon]|nr:AMP-binding protein [Nitrososphaerota archaeon]
MSGSEILGESLPFDEMVELNDWKNYQVDPNAYKAIHAASVSDSAKHWENIAKELEWYGPWESVVKKGDHPHVYKWFAGGKINLCNLALDRHARTNRRNKLALIWEGEPVGGDGSPREVRKFTYGELLEEVNRMAFLLSERFGLRKGDRLAVYLPLIPEAIITLLAAARLGVTFTVVFSGYSAEALSSRMNDLGASVLVTADGFYRRGKKILLKEIVDKALEQTPTVHHVIVVGRLGGECDMTEGRDHLLSDLTSHLPPNPVVAPEEVESEHPLYVLYTSGTTGKPKGMIHDTGGYSVLLHATMNWVFD